MNELVRKPIFIYSGIAVVIIILLSVYLLTTQPDNENELLEEPDWIAQEKREEAAEVESDTHIVVDVKGAVAVPGVYELTNESRIHEVIHLAGGFLDEADRDSVNLALRVSDEMVLYIPYEGEEQEINLLVHNGEIASALVNLNTATESELQTLQGVGPAKAAAIIQYREENGLFNTIEEITNVSGIGDKSFDSLKDMISVQ
ncbi:helix-hairpin-helix domain-containing protein [Shouchella patagoniensis]|uniref:helix-hairpin-helix domain-containing protein n=1 Tax=Shouchella patagoniensis TaxID=228576 RepID=UPI00099527C6|nr:helix-hairpin-helix domain-containing protein [Shouchella patagoniensis]